MKVKIDYDLCMGDGNCARKCPEVFDYNDGDLQGIVKDVDIPAELEEKVRRVAEECAPGAIIIE